MLNWFEIPVVDFERALDFYKAVLHLDKIDVESGPKHQVGFFTMYKNKVSGAIVKAKGYEPSKTGAIVYLNAYPDMDKTILRIKEAGGTIVVPKTLISKKAGYIAKFEDMEGNLLGLHGKN